MIKVDFCDDLPFPNNVQILQVDQVGKVHGFQPYNNDCQLLHLTLIAPELCLHFSALILYTSLKKK